MLLSSYPLHAFVWPYHTQALLEHAQCSFGYPKPVLGRKKCRLIYTHIQVQYIKISVPIPYMSICGG